ncbi:MULTISPECIES: hypothetical protein [unclassified Streptomyces]|uniref:hypothetical protein n=1 Tax=unclassified Streptomyces TaxID=2593676 RepID=UPI003BB7028D
MMTADPFPTEPEPVAVDTIVDRPDLGPGCATLVAAGTPVPVHLVDFSRRATSDNSNSNSASTKGKPKRAD